MRAAVEQIEQAEGAVGVLINNAGYSQSGAIETVPLDAVRRQFETNVFGLVRLTQLVLPRMRAQRWGKIVNVGSMGGRLSFPGGGPLPRDQARARGDLRRAALRAARLRHRRDPARARPDHDRVRRGGRREHGGQRAPRRPATGRIPTRSSTRPSAPSPKAPTTARCACSGAGPDRVAKVIEKALTRRRPPARITITPVGEAPDRDPAPALRSRLGRDDAQAVSPAAIGLRSPLIPRRAERHRAGAAGQPRSPGRSRRRSFAAGSIVG